MGKMKYHTFEFAQRKSECAAEAWWYPKMQEELRVLMRLGYKSKKGLSKIIKNFGRATGKAFKLVGSRNLKQVFEEIQ